MSQPVSQFERLMCEAAGCTSEAGEVIERFNLCGRCAEHWRARKRDYDRRFRPRVPKVFCGTCYGLAHRRPRAGCPDCKGAYRDE